MNSLPAIEAIVSKHLASKRATTTETTKRIVKRPYGVSVTDLDVFAENVLKKKKNDQKLMKKKSTDNVSNVMPKANSKKRKTSSNTATIRFDPDTSQTLLSMNESSSGLYHYHPNITNMSSSFDLPNTESQVFHCQSDSYVLQELQNIPISASGTCGRCRYQMDVVCLGGYCMQCNVPICWQCWSEQNCNLNYCNSYRFLNRTKQGI